MTLVRYDTIIPTACGTYGEAGLAASTIGTLLWFEKFPQHICFWGAKTSSALHIQSSEHRYLVQGLEVCTLEARALGFSGSKITQSRQSSLPRFRFQGLGKTHVAPSYRTVVTRLFVLGPFWRFHITLGETRV